MGNEFRKAADVINSMFSGFNIEGINQSNSFIKSWNQIVGDKIGSHSKVIDVDRGSVIVEVDHPGWSQQIQFRKKQILGELSRSFPELALSNIIMRVVTECRTPYVKQDSTVGAGLHRQETIEDLPDIAVRDDLDDSLKDVLERLKASMKKGKPV
jgi:Protein of unknown function (DUF721).